MEYLLRKGLKKLEERVERSAQLNQQAGQAQYSQQPPYFQQAQYSPQSLHPQQPQYSSQQQYSPQQTGSPWLPQYQTQHMPMQTPQISHIRNPSSPDRQYAPPPLPPRSAPPQTVNQSRPPLHEVLSAPTVLPPTRSLGPLAYRTSSDPDDLALQLNGALHISKRADSKSVAGTSSTHDAPQNQPTPQPSVLRVQGTQPSALKKILCLDGGGVRGLASLMIVKNLMDLLGTQRGGRLEPWQEFDMIGGTSTGGLIAIMLGRLRMSVDDCIDAYTKLSEKIFEPVLSKANVPGRAIQKLRAEGKFEAHVLEEQIKQLLRKRGWPEEALLTDNSADAPKVFVTAVQAIDADSVVIRSYNNSRAWDEVSSRCRIWEAARATSAASTFFDPITIGNIRYVDGALQDNNPIFKADEESRGTWCRAIGYR